VSLLIKGVTKLSHDDAPRDDTIDSKITTHKGDASAHHAKTTDAGDIISGRFGNTRLEWTADKLLKGAGAGNDPVEIDVPSGATKEFFMPATDGTTRYNNDYFTGFQINAEDDYALIVFYVPQDFTSTTDAVVVIIPGSTSHQRFNIVTNYGAEGEDYDTNTDFIADIDTNLNIKKFYEIDVSDALDDLAAGDYVAVRIYGDAVDTPNSIILGVRFKYS